ncbi:hypothetical protein [Streptomyces seoulensis]|uniref:hypothetical protein n=1 Tax=Streptomyces seoulensis TaxID=73044 RepID=UPI001FCA7A1F|nr:hypothetical protein [Streptomyces seoulensis]BDH04858.1 hypothetical protein HEK131_20850 [Streptomyces seoulensis]
MSKRPKNTPVDGPFRITVESIPTGVTLDVEAFVQHVVTDVVTALLTDDHFADRLGDLYEALPVDPHAVLRPGDLGFESLVADLVAVAGTKLPVYGRQGLALADRIRRLAAVAVAVGMATKGGAAA